MTQVEVVALWVGLISSIVGVVLSVVAIVFAVLVNNRASDINDRMIESLQKTQFSVERSSEDTRDLIKAGWDKMLVNVGKSPETHPDNASVREIASGLSAELRAGLGLRDTPQSQGDSVQPEQIERLNDLLENLETSLEIQLDILSRSETSGETFEYVLDELGGLSTEALELARAVVRHHLTLDQYRSLLSSSQLSGAIGELRASGLLVPLEGYSREGNEILVYYFPSSLTDMIKAALQLLPEAQSDVQKAVQAELNAVNYPEDGTSQE